MKLSILIVPYRCREQLKVTLDAVYASRVDFEYEVIIIDNDPDFDGTRQMVENEFLNKPEIKNKTIYIPNSSNVGFVKANNQALKISKGEYKLLLNPDTKVSPETFQVMMDFMESRPDVGIATCKLVRGNGQLDLACRRSFPDFWVAVFRMSGLSFLFPNNKRLAAYNLTYKNIDEETEIDTCSGAFTFVSPECYKKIQYLDEDFYMYNEDVDWCWRAKEAGFKVWYYPKTTTIHYKGVSSRQNPYALYAFHETMWIFYKKHLINRHSKLLVPIIWTGIWTRYWLKRTVNALRGQSIVSK